MDGQAVNQGITNPAFINKNTNDVMPNQLAFNRPLSGPSIADIQQAVNNIYTATGVSEVTSGTDYNATPNTISNGDSYQVALGILANKFAGATGHNHDGTDGQGPVISAVTSIAASGFTPLTGHIIVESGTGVQVTEVGQNIIISATGAGTGVNTIAASGNVGLTGNVFLVQGTGIQLTQLGQNITIAASGGGSSSNYVNIIEPIEQKSQDEHYSIITDRLDNSVSSGFNQNPGSYYNQGILQQSTTGSSASVVWSPVVLNNAAKDTTTTTNWSNVAGTITLTTSATTQVGATSVSFTKNATGLASIKYDYGGLGFFIPNNTRLWFWINLANLTSFTSVNITLSADATTYGTNFQTWTLTTNYAGTPIATGWNLCFLDVSTGGSATGTGWNYTIAARFFTIGINTGSNTSTVILINGIYFSYNQPSQYVPVGNELTVFNATNTEIFQVDSANTQVDGPITLTNSLANTYAGGFVGASVYRSTLSIGNNQALLGTTDPNGNVLAGAITTSQSVRLSRILRSSLSGNTLTATATVNTSQVYSISSTTTNVIVVNDIVNQIANLLIGDILHVFSSNYEDGLDNFIYLGDFTLTSNATNGSNLTTLTGTGGVPVGTAAGGYVAKKHVTASYSAVTSAANESFVSLSPIASPDGIILMDNGLKYPYPQNVWAHYPLGNPYTTKNIYGAGANLTQVGTITYTSVFKNGAYAASGWTAANYLNDGTTVSPIDGTTNTKFSVSIWYYASSNAAAKILISKSNNATTGWSIGVGTLVANTLTVGINTGTALTSTATLSMNNWNHVVLNYSAGATLGTTLWLNGVCVGNATATISANTNNMSIGVVSTNTAPLTATDQVADAILWSGVNLTQTQILQIYNNGIAVPVGFINNVKYRYQASGVSGQKLTYKLALSTDTVAVTPTLTNAAIIKTS